MKTKLSKTIFTAVLTSAMALGTGTSLWAQDPSMDKPSAGVSAQVDQATAARAARAAIQCAGPERAAGCRASSTARSR